MKIGNTTTRHSRRLAKTVASAIKNIQNTELFPRFYSQKNTGLPPGEIIHVGKVKVDQSTFSKVTYSSQELEIKENCTWEEIITIPTGKNDLTWINITGIHDPFVLREIGALYEIDPLTLEDIANTRQRPKIEDFDKYLFVCLKKLSLDAEYQVTIDQISLVMTDNCVISFHEKPDPIFNNIITRLKNPKGKLRTRGSDYLLYCLIDTIIDNYLHILEETNIYINSIEEEIFESPSDHHLRFVQNNNKKIQRIWRIIMPVKESLNGILKEKPLLVDKTNLKYFKDAYDHVITAMDMVFLARELNTTMRENYISGISLKMNKIMQVLTIMSTIFIPLTFIAGVYGMNFNNMPELDYQYGYPIVWGVMIITSLTLIAFFKKKQWL